MEGKKLAAALAKRGLFLLAAVTVLLWALSKPSLAAVTGAPLVSLAQLAGLVGVTALAWNFFLASRPIVLDKAMGGLDKVFIQHRRAGTAAFTLMLAHPLFLAASALPNWPAAKFFLLPGPFWALNFGIFALWSFSLLIVLTLFVKLPYHVWKRTHQFMGVPFAFVALHVATIESDVAWFLPLRVWILGLIAVGLGSYAYKIFLYRFFGPRHPYRIEAVRELGDVVEVSLAPEKRPLAHRPGQFVFVSFGDDEVGREEHPFTISSAPGEPLLRLSMKKSGDHTKKFGRLKPGVAVRVFGPYGRFGEAFLETHKDSIWIAGGIGVTPFLSLLRAAAPDEPAKVAIIYSTKNESDAPYDAEIASVAARVPNIAYSRHLSEKEGYLTAEEIAKRAGGLKDKLVFLCGPMPMMRALTSALTASGVPRRNILFEDFSLR